MPEEVLRAVNERQPAIDPEKLKLPDGEFANKRSLLKFAYEAGLPVPKIIPEAELQEYWRKSDKDSLYRRGFFQDPVDMWTVNTLPTTQVFDLLKDGSCLPEIDEVTKQYLARNFGLAKMPPAGSFLQESVPDSIYLSTWSFGNDVFGVVRTSTRRKNLNHFYMDKQRGELIDWSEGMTRIDVDFVKEGLYPQDEQVKPIFDGALKGKFDYKVDYLLDEGGLHIIQIRVASEEVSEQHKIDNIKVMRNLVTNGIPLIRSEIGELKSLPQEPYIFKLTNNWHRGTIDAKTKLSLDMTGMQGLLLPFGLKGGLLEHSGDIFIAYALYWGLPIAIDSEFGGLLTA